MRCQYFMLGAASWAVAIAVLSPRGDQKVLSSEGNALGLDGETVHDELIKAEIIPTVIDDFTPAFLLTAEWSPKAEAGLGNTLKPEKLKDAPTLTLTPTETTQVPSAAGPAIPSAPRLCGKGGLGGANTTSNVTYAVVLTDPDAPSRNNPKWSEFCHWIATGHVAVTPKPPPGRRAREAWLESDDDRCAPLVLTGLEDVMPYKPPAPPKKTGRHRYVLLAFTPLNATTERLNVTKPEERKHWGTGKEGRGVRDWAEENGLVPIAANFIYAQNKKQ